ncbi:MAG: MBL fold metallo-hydrolase [candidate division WOR-3 bacterium]
MKVKWFGHAAFLLVASDGTKIIADPYIPGCFDNALCYGQISETADAVTESHDHDDHAGGRMLPGRPPVLRGAGEHQVKSITITGLDTAHDDAAGAKRGRNTVFLYCIDGLKIVHLGDLGEPLPAAVSSAIGQVDVLLVPVGGYFTIDATQAHKTAEALGARIIIPMHYRTGKCSFQIQPVDQFLQGRVGVRRFGTSEVEITKDKLPAAPEIWVLHHAL